MRYNNLENTVLAGKFITGKTIKIKIIDMETDGVVTLQTEDCTESTNIPGIYLWNTTNLPEGNGLKNLLYEMYDSDDSTVTFNGKFVYGGIQELANTQVIEKLNELLGDLADGVTLEDIEGLEDRFKNIRIMV